MASVAAMRAASRAEIEGTRKFLRIRIRDTTLDLVPNLDLDEAFVVRSSNPGNLPIESFLGAFGMDSLFILWWVARRQNGEPKLSFKDAKAEWPTSLTEDEFDLIEVDLDGEPDNDSPESSGPDSNKPGPTSPTSSESTPGTSDA